MKCEISREPLPSELTNSDEPLTPAGRLFLRPEMDTIIHGAFGLKDSLNVEAIKEVVTNSLMLKHPRFCSLLVRDKSGRERWRRTQVQIDRHVIVVDRKRREDDDSERIVNDYIADLSVSSPLGLNKPLWEIHLLTAERCLVFRIHHALGDGISLMSFLLADCRKISDPHAPAALPEVEKSRRSRSVAEAAGDLLMMVVFSLVFCLDFVMRTLWIRDRRTMISGGAGVELWPRKLATARFSIDDMRTVKATVPNATINDVLFAVVTSGLSKYLAHRTPEAVKQGQQLTGVAMVNLRKQPGLQELSDMMESSSAARWGNKFGILLLPLFYQHFSECSDPLEPVRSAKRMIDRKKTSLEARFSYHIGDLVMSLFGPKAPGKFNYRIMSNTTFMISNVIGPKEEISFFGNPVTYIRGNISSFPHALTMLMVSYAGKVDMQILVAKDIIPDPEFLAKCFQDSLLEMKTAAAQKAASLTC
ncbi:Wax ester synthase/diacylglycerol acyltransferase 5 [Linum grandiflorum]